MNIHDYWTLSPAEQAKIKTQNAKTDEDLVRYQGAWIPREGYPCECELLDPEQCYAEKHSLTKGTCECGCHEGYTSW